MAFSVDANVSMTFCQIFFQIFKFLFTFKGDTITMPYWHPPNTPLYANA